MTEYDDEGELAKYVWAHYPKLFTPVEAKTWWAVFAEDKQSLGHGPIPQIIWKRHGLTDDPKVAAELAGGTEAFRRRAAQRVLRDHPGEIVVNRCPRCNGIARTPQARQCFWCGFDWHPNPPEQH